MKNISVLFCLLFLTPSFSQSRSSLQVGSKAPKINITNWIHNTPKDKNLKNKVIVLEFWATWCAPCIKAVPHLNKIQKKFKGNDNVVFLSLSDEKEATIKKKLKKVNFSSIVVSDITKQTNKNFGVKFLPLTLIIDKQHVIKWIGGPNELNYELIKEVIDNKPISKKYISNFDLFSIKNTNKVYTNIDYKTFSKLIKDKDVNYYFSIKESSDLRNTSLKIGENIFSYSSIPLKKLLSQLYKVNYTSLHLPKDLASKRYAIAYKNTKLKNSTQKLLKEILAQLELKKEQKKIKKTIYDVKLNTTSKLIATTVKPKEFSSFSVTNNILSAKKQTIPNLLKTIEIKSGHTFQINNATTKKYYDFEIDLTDIASIKKDMNKYGFNMSQKEVYADVIEIKHAESK